MDDPFFPPPGSKTPYRADDRPPVVVTRVTRADEPAPAASKLTKEEISALLTTVEAGRDWGQARRRMLVFIPVSLISWFLESLLGGTTSLVVALGVGVACLVWVSRPLFRKSALD